MYWRFGRIFLGYTSSGLYHQFLETELELGLVFLRTVLGLVARCLTDHDGVSDYITDIIEPR